MCVSSGALLRRVRAAACLAPRRACSGRAGEGAGGGAGTPLRRLLDEASAFGEAAPAEGELRWATQPYAAAAAGERRRPAPTPHDATVLLFPGQGSQYVGMGARLRDVPAARDLYALASDVVGWDVWRVCSAGPAAALREHAQVCVTVTALAALEAAHEARPAALQRARVAAGYSLGEFAALVFAGALSLDAALRVLTVRAAAMREAAARRPGGMLSVWLAPDAQLPRLLREARDAAGAEGVCAVAAYLYPGCKVLAGDEAALRHVEGAGRACGVRRAARVAVEGAWHCELMADTREAVREALRAVRLEKPRLRVYSCAEARPYGDAAHVARALARLAAAPVRWEQTLHALFARPREHAAPLTLALGPGVALRATLKQVNARAWDACVQVDA